MKDINEEIMKKALEGGDYPKPILVEDLGMLFATEKSKQKVRFGIYKCGFCGNKFKSNTYDINRGNIKSCGCHHQQRVKECNSTHNLINTKIYSIWNNMKGRTLNPKDKAYSNYGGRGITICDEWKMILCLSTIGLGQMDMRKIKV